jgi:hypothetical protein
MVVWQAADRNEWNVVINRALAGFEAATAVGDVGPDPFSLAAPATVEGILWSAGFTDVDLADVGEPVYYGPDAAAALDWVRGFTCTQRLLKRLDPAAADRALARLRDALAARAGDEGIWFDSRAWIVTAHRRRAPGGRAAPAAP